MIVVNFKTYKEATGFKALELAYACKRIEEETKVRIVAVPQLPDLYQCVETGVECWVQHVDPIEQGRNTGWVDREAVEEAGAKGTLLSHSEHKLSTEVLSKTVEVVGGHSFVVCVCVGSAEEAALITGLRPQVDFVAFEPADLIGSTDRSVSSEKPDEIQKVIQSAGNIPVLVGAGVHSVEDIKVALKIGAKGVLLATDVVKASDPEEELRKLALAFK